MNEKEITGRYSKYFDYIKRLSIYELWETPSLTDLKMTRATIQSCYREIKELSFRGSIVDYLCLISTNYVLLHWGKSLNRKSSQKENEKWLSHFIYSDPDVAKNMLRLFSKDTSYIFKSSVLKLYSPENSLENKFRFFQVLNIMRFSIEHKLTMDECFNLIDSLG